MASVVERDKNHPSVIMWSLGNEAGHGENIQAMAEYARRADPTRPLQYRQMNSVVDTDNLSYQTVEWIINQAKEHPDRPFLMEEQENEYVIKGTNFSITFGKDSGVIELFNYKGKQLIASPLVPNFWRVPVDNGIENQWDHDTMTPIGGMPIRLGVWKTAGRDRKVRTITAKQTKPQVFHIFTHAILPPGDTDYYCVYTVFESGDVIIENHILPENLKVPELPRIGMQMTIPGEFNKMIWYGRGPHESYWDRNTGAAIGLYSGFVEDLIHSYVRPQENGNRTDVRWVAFTNESGAGLLAVGMPLLYVSAWPYTMDDLEQAKHIHELPRRDNITVNLDYKQMGIGGDDGWTEKARPHPEYRLPLKKYNYSYRLQPYEPTMGEL